MYLTFPSSLKGVASDWFYSLPLSLHNFEEVFKAFLIQYASHRETKRNNHQLLTIKMRQSDSLKFYIGYLQSQLVKVPNCDEDVLHLRSSVGCKSFTPCTNIF